MAGPVRSLTLARFALAVSIVAASVATAVGFSAAVPGPATAASLPTWTGGVDLYRSGAFSTQRTWLWCTAADIQIISNIVDGQAAHSKAGQQRYFDYMRTKDRYPIPVSDGIDPAGWTAGLRRFVDSRYQLYASRSFDSALRSAVTNLRRTNLPVAMTVAHGNHAWIITGFTATADPARTTDFTVTSVRVVGPLWGLQSRTYGYDMKPDTKLTPKQLAGFFTPWHYAPIKMAWEDRWVSIQALVAQPAAPKGARPAPTPPAVTEVARGATGARGAMVARLEPIPSIVPSGDPGPAAATVATPFATAQGAAGPVGPPALTKPVADQSSLAWVGLVLGLAAFSIVAVRRRHPAPRSRTGRPSP